jgi:hypothetical protein
MRQNARIFVRTWVVLGVKCGGRAHQERHKGKERRGRAAKTSARVSVGQRRVVEEDDGGKWALVLVNVMTHVTAASLSRTYIFRLCHLAFI